NLGEASQGKLKAHELLILFTIILPLVIRELWWRGNETVIRMLEYRHVIFSSNGSKR
ncbi:hypothetical protein GG344DRAFT_60826, partial [Lentinula edodes]